MKMMLTADWHLRKDRPICRQDDNWIETQLNVLKYIANECNVRDCPLYIIGDVFHRPCVGPMIIAIFLKITAVINRGVYILAGNHDLPYHNWENVSGTDYGILHEICQSSYDRLNAIPDYFLSSGHFGQYGPCREEEIAFSHELVSNDLDDLIQCKTTDEMFYKTFPFSKWIFTGDNHNYFYVCKNSRHIINPGCITIQKRTEEEYVPDKSPLNSTLPEPVPEKDSLNIAESGVAVGVGVVPVKSASNSVILLQVPV